MERLEAMADLVIRRAVGFAGLAIMLVVLSLSFQLSLALRSGALLVTLLWLIVLLKLAYVPNQNMRQSELWLMVAERHSPDALPMQAAMRTAFANRLRWHADRIGAFAISLWGSYLLVSIFTCSPGRLYSILIPVAATTRCHCGASLRNNAAFRCLRLETLAYANRITYLSF